MAVEVAVASYLRVELKFKFSARSDEPFRKSSADRQTYRHPKFFGITRVRGFSYRSANNISTQYVFIPQGTFVVRNVTTDFDIKVIPVFFYGKWRVTLRMLRTDNKETVGCLRVFGESVPKLQR